MLEHNNPAVDYEALSTQVLDESIREGDSSLKGFSLGARLAVLRQFSSDDLALAEKAHRVKSPFPSFLNAFLRDQGSVNRALFKSLEGVLDALSIQEELNAALLEELNVLKQSKE